jgi:hypothetical protein
MKKKIFRLSILLVVGFSLFALAERPVPASNKPKPEELVTKSLDAIGTKEARAALKSIAIEGNLRVHYLMGGTGDAGGPFNMISSGQKFAMESKFDIPNYPGENYAFDGDKKTIGFMTPGQRSYLEDFLNNNGEILAEGLLGGELSTAWPLNDWQSRKAKLDSDGLKKVDGKELYRMTYLPRHGGGDLKIYIFFDPETFRHVKTIYSLVSQAQMGTSPGMSSVGGGAHLTLEENFGGFAKVNDLSLPSQWMMKYTQEGIGNGVSIIEYDLAISRIQLNADVSSQTFKIAQ